MVEEAKTNETVAARVQMYDYRRKEELYDLKKDPDALENLVDRPEYLETVTRYRQKMLRYMENTKDAIVVQYGKAILDLDEN